LLFPYIDKDISDFTGPGSVFLCPANRTDDNNEFLLLTDYGYLCNLRFMPRYSGSNPDKFRAVSAYSVVNNNRILVADTVMPNEEDGVTKQVFINTQNDNLENSRKPLTKFDDKYWEVHKGGINTLWVDYSVRWMAVSDVNRPGSEINSGNYFGGPN